jgi:hypothetical protein
LETLQNQFFHHHGSNHAEKCQKNQTCQKNKIIKWADSILPKGWKMGVSPSCTKGI